MIDNVALNKFSKIYDESYLEVSKYVVLNCSKIDDVDDILQNIYIDVFKCIKRNTNIDISYIIGIAKNKVKDYYRFRYKDKIISIFMNDKEEAFERIPSNFNLEKTIINKYDVDRLWEYLKRKKIIIFKIFYLYYYLGLSIREIAKLLNISQSNVKHYIYRTLNELSFLIESEGDKNV